MGTYELYFIAFFYIFAVSNVYHDHIHTYITYRRGILPFDIDLRYAVSKISKIQNNYELTAQEANCYLMKKEIKKALESYEKAYFLKPNQELAQFLSIKYLESGDTVNYNKYKGL